MAAARAGCSSGPTPLTAKCKVAQQAEESDVTWAVNVEGYPNDPAAQGIQILQSHAGADQGHGEGRAPRHYKDVHAAQQLALTE
jgi:hypothetical protein